MDASPAPPPAALATPARRRGGAWTWALVALAAVTFALTAMGVGESMSEYYASIALSISRSWPNFFFAAVDPAGTLARDKIPGSFWITTLSARLFGFPPRRSASPMRWPRPPPPSSRSVHGRRLPDVHARVVGGVARPRRRVPVHPPSVASQDLAPRAGGRCQPRALARLDHRGGADPDIPPLLHRQRRQHRRLQRRRRRADAHRFREARRRWCAPIRARVGKHRRRRFVARGLLRQHRNRQHCGNSDGSSSADTSSAQIRTWVLANCTAVSDSTVTGIYERGG